LKDEFICLLPHLFNHLNSEEDWK